MIMKAIEESAREEEARKSRVRDLELE